jgi:HEAT repeat protein
MTKNWTRNLAMGLTLGLLVPASGQASASDLSAGELALAVRQEAQQQAQQQAEEQARQHAEQEALQAYRAARQALNSREFQRAVALFNQVRDAYPASQYAADSHYWEAFAHYRLQELQEALALLEMQLQSYPEARTSAEARELALRLEAQLGERGNARAAERAMRAAEAALSRSSDEVARAMARAEARGERRATAGEHARQEACGEEDDVRHAAVTALMRMDSERALPVLMKVLQRRDECSAPLRRQAIFVLAQQGGTEDVEAVMLDVAQNDPDPEVREAAVLWLSQVGSEGAVDALVDILATSDDPRIQEKAIFALSQHMSDRAAEVLRSYAMDASKPEHIRQQAIVWISQHEVYSDPQFLIDLYAELDSPELKQMVFVSLARSDGEGAVDWMLERALDSDEDMELRTQALFWAGQSGADLTLLEGLYESGLDREMKEQLIMLYSQRHDEPAAIARLIEIARAETDPELRKAAIFWLGQSGDEDAIQFLLELVEP